MIESIYSIIEDENLIDRMVSYLNFKERLSEIAHKYQFSEAKIKKILKEDLR